MFTLLQETIAHIQNTLGEVRAVQPWSAASGLPVYLADRYEFYTANLIGRDCLLALSRSEQSDTPAVIKKHMQTLAGRTGCDVAYVVRKVTPYNRKRLIEHRVPFVVPRTQIYLPGFGVDLREQFTKRNARPREGLGAVAQVLVLREIYHCNTSDQQLSECAQVLGYSAMTIGRAVDELAANGLARLERAGKSKHIAFTANGRDLWEKAKDLMQTPVKHVTWVDNQVSFYAAQKAGESALAEYTMLSSPRNTTIALYEREWARIKPAPLHEDIIAEGAALRVERWRYNPRLVTQGPLVDELSLWLSLQGHGDERVLIAADQLLERVPW